MSCIMGLGMWFDSLYNEFVKIISTGTNTKNETCPLKPFVVPSTFLENVMPVYSQFQHILCAYIHHCLCFYFNWWKMFSKTVWDQG
jgi:hypothetical protein